MLGPQTLEGKVALVTGGSRGIGAGISRKLASVGATVFVNYVERDGPAAALAEELRAGGASVHLLKGDVSDAASIEEIMAEVERTTGGLDILVHNAAASVYRSLWDTSLAHFDFTIATSTHSMVLLAKAARPLMVGRAATIIAISNRSASQHAERAAVFCAAKAALEALVRSLSVELAADGIVVNCVRPGTVGTEIVRIRPELGRKLDLETEVSPWHRVTTPEDVGDVVALLCLPEARWIAGQTITADGGWSVWR